MTVRMVRFGGGEYGTIYTLRVKWERHLERNGNIERILFGFREKCVHGHDGLILGGVEIVICKRSGRKRMHVVAVRLLHAAQSNYVLRVIYL